jgi:hypothetical protein
VRIISRCPLLAEDIREIGVTDMRLLTIGIPSSLDISFPIFTRLPALDYLIVYLVASALFAVGNTVKERYSQRNRAHVEVLLGNHIYRFYNFVA